MESKITGSKDQVNCTSCGQELRKDTIERHWRTQHPGQKLELGQSKWKSKPVKGQVSLQNFGFKTVPAIPAEKDPGLVVSDDHLEKVDEECDSPNKRLHDLTDENENIPCKKVKYSEQTVVEEKIDGIATDVKEIKELLMKKTNFLEEPKQASLEGVENDPVEVVLKHSRTKEQFDMNIVQLKIKKEDDVKPNQTGYYCEICFDGIKPKFGVQQSGMFLLDNSKDNTTEQKLSAVLKNLKKHVKSHIESKVHQQKLDIIEARNKRDEDRNSRLKTVGLNIFRTRYCGIKQARSRSDFEQDILKGKMNGEDLGNINHSRMFAKTLDEAIFKTMRDDIRVKVKTNLDATGATRPFGLVFDKMTPNKTTGQIHGVILPVPENPLSQDFLVPLMLDIPPVHDHSAAGLAISAKETFNSFGLADEMLEGIGVDGEYIKKGVKTKLLDLLEIEGWTEAEKDKWITAVWEPAHQLELTTKDVRNEKTFDWLENTINVISDITNLLGIGKGLEQSKEAAGEVGEKFVKLKTLSDTRFAAYFESALDNFERRTETTIAALRKRIQSTDKKVKDKASKLLSEMCSRKFCLLLLA